MPSNNPPRISGALFAGTSQNGPAFKGMIEIDGVKHFICLWPKQSKAGADYLQVSEDKKKSGTQAGGFQSKAQAPQGFKPRPQTFGTQPNNNRIPPSLDDDDIPF